MDPKENVDKELNRFAEFVKEVEWKFSWKYAAHSLLHEYITLNADNRELFTLFDKLIKKYGKKARFKTSTYRYLFLDGFKFWRIGVVLNCERLRGCKVNFERKEFKRK